MFTAARHWTVPYHIPICFNIIRSSYLPVSSFKDLRPKILDTFPPSPNPLDMIRNLHSLWCRVKKKLQSSSFSYLLHYPVTWYLPRNIFSTIRNNSYAMIRYISAHLINLYNYKEPKFIAQHNA